MTSTSRKTTKAIASRKDRPGGSRGDAPRRSKSPPQYQQQPWTHEPTPAAGAHAAPHLINEDATPGAGVLPSYAHASGKEVDGGAG